MTKSELRQQALRAREAGGDAQALTAHLGTVLRAYQGKVLAGYWPMRGEADPRPAMANHDGPLCLPVVIGRGQPLAFRRWHPGEPLQPGTFGTRHPPESAGEVTPSVLIVPLAGFDRFGNRIGYGGGFYDRTLAALRRAGPVTAIGLAYAVQEVPQIPAEHYDQPLDVIVTDAGIRWITPPC